MEPQFIRAYRVDAADDAPADGPITFVASTEDVARDGFSIAHDGWDLSNFKRNPLFLWAHDYWGSRPPIGRVKARIDKDAKALMAEVTFDLADPFAADIYRKYREGFLNAVSVGFDIKEIDGKTREDSEGGWFWPKPGSMVTKSELLELSGVPVPADPKALAERMQRGLTSDLSDLLLRLTDDTASKTEPSEFVWPGLALQMARLFLDTSDDDEIREANYRRFSRQYRDLGKEPPEWMTRYQLSGLEAADIHGLFGSGEAELLGWETDGVRKGAVLSARNLGDLDQIITLAQGIKERAVKESETSEEDAERVFLERFMPKSTEPDDLLRRLAG